MQLINEKLKKFIMHLSETSFWYPVYVDESTTLTIRANKEPEAFIRERIEDVNISNETMLHIASRIGDTVVAKKLLEMGININALDEVNDTALHTSVANNDYQMSLLLLKNGAMINVENDFGETAVSMAKEIDNEKIKNLFLDLYKKMRNRKQIQPRIHIVMLPGNRYTIVLTLGFEDVLKKV